MARYSKTSLIESLLPDGLPSLLYKYNKIEANLHNSLKGGYLWHSGRTSFNDPYECYKHLLTFEPTTEQLKDYARRTLMPGESLPEVTEYMLNNTDRVTESYVETIDAILDSYGICCFTKNYKSTLMWSHYANHHKGICLVFDTQKDSESFLVAKVRYTDEFTPRNYFDDYDNSAMIALTTKAKDWEYEQEYRLVSGIQGAIPFNKEALVEVIFGCKVSQDDMLSVIHTIETSGYNNVQYTKAEMLPNSFQLAFRTSPWLDSTY